MADDPRDPVVEPPADDPMFAESRRFRQRLAASAQIQVLAYLVGHVHALYEGWPTPHAPSLLHARAAELAVRYSAPECRAAALTAAEGYLLDVWERLQQELRSPDLTERQRDAVIAREARFTIETFLYHLLHAGGRSPHEWRNFEDAEARIALEMGGE